MFTVAGVSVCKGKVKVRFCSDKVLRIKNLQKQGDTDIDLVDLPRPMNKYDACQFLLDNGQFAKFATDIIEIQGKKQLTVTKNKAIMKPEVDVDSEIEAIKELAVA
jgi:hypothetical protein